MSDSRIYGQLDRIESKLDTVESRLGAMDTHLAKYNLELQIHIKRTEALEAELLPISKQVEQVKGMGLLAAAVAFLASVVGSVAWLWGK